MARTISLSRKERTALEQYARSQVKAAEVRRARCLLLADRGWTVDAIAEALGCGTATVKRVKARYREEGWSAAVAARYAGGPPPMLGSLEERRLIALACSDAPDGERWTIRALSEESGVSRMTVQRTLERDGLKPWREKNVVRRRAR